jgi:hypothetical protein
MIFEEIEELAELLVYVNGVELSYYSSFAI